MGWAVDLNQKPLHPVSSAAVEAAEAGDSEAVVEVDLGVVTEVASVVAVVASEAAAVAVLVAVLVEGTILVEEAVVDLEVASGQLHPITVFNTY